MQKAKWVHFQAQLRPNVYRAILKKQKDTGAETMNALFELMLLDSAGSGEETKSVIDALLGDDRLESIPKALVK